MIKEAIIKIVDKQDLTYQEAYDVMNEIMNGETTQVQNAAFLAALSTKSTRRETIDEISGCAAAMATTPQSGTHLSGAEIVAPARRANTFNISTTARWWPSAGVQVPSRQPGGLPRSGTARLHRGTGHRTCRPRPVLALLEEVGMCFFFAQVTIPR
jgi:anthranilate phosphoribosyltransferase